MKHPSLAAAAKATLVGGAIFLIPGFLAVFVVGKVFSMLRGVALAIGPKLGITGPVGGVILDVAVIAILALVCFLAGLMARQAAAQRLRTRLDHLLLASFPGYAFIKGMAENMQQSQEIANSFIPVLLTFGEFSQVAFETEREPSGVVAVYLPGAPNPWSGNVLFVNAERVKKLPISVTEALKIQRTLGRGSELIAAANRRRGAAVAEEQPAATL